VRVYVNDTPVRILPGMTVRHALIACGLKAHDIASLKVLDAWGNEVGLDGELSHNEKILFTRGDKQ